MVEEHGFPAASILAVPWCGRLAVVLCMLASTAYAAVCLA